MASIPVLNESGKKVGDESIDDALLGGKINASLLKQAVVMYQANHRQGTVKQQSRGEVDGSTRKLFKQKGTGRARMGNLRQPVRRGGGRAFPRKPRDFRQGMPRQMRRLARNQAILAKILSEQAIIVEGVEFDSPKTTRLVSLLTAIKADRGCIMATAGTDRNVYLSGRNIRRTEVLDVADLNAGDILSRRHLIFTRPAFEALRNQLSGK